jgi:hypothetical protein
LVTLDDQLGEVKPAPARPGRRLDAAQPPREDLGIGQVDQEEIGAAEGLDADLLKEGPASFGTAARRLGPKDSKRDTQAEDGEVVLGASYLFR